MSYSDTTIGIWSSYLLINVRMTKWITYPFGLSTDRYNILPRERKPENESFNIKWFLKVGRVGARFYFLDPKRVDRRRICLLIDFCKINPSRLNLCGNCIDVARVTECGY